jgi:hypothetical protein
VEPSERRKPGNTLNCLVPSFLPTDFKLDCERENL